MLTLFIFERSFKHEKNIEKSSKICTKKQKGDRKDLRPPGSPRRIICIRSDAC